MAKKRSNSASSFAHLVAITTVVGFGLVILLILVSSMNLNGLRSIPFFSRAAEKSMTPQTTGWGNAAQLDGQTGFISSLGATSLWPHPGYTMEAWVKPVSPDINGSSKTYTIARYDTTDGVEEFRINIQPQGSYYIVNYGIAFPTSPCYADIYYATRNVYSSQELSQWQHLAAVYQNSGSINLFLNGTLQTTWVAPVYHVCSTNHDFRIGDPYSPSSVGKFNGQIDEFRVSNIARYTSNFTPQTVPFENDHNTVLLYHLDAAIKVTAYSKGVTPDYSGNNHGGTLVGTVDLVPSSIGQ